MISTVRDFILSALLYKGVRVLYALLFLYAGLNKLLNPGAFATVIDAFGLVPDILIMPIAVVLPVLEILTAIGLILDVRSSLAAVTGLLLFLLAVVSYGIWMGLDIDCGCFGLGDPEGEAYKSLRSAFYRNIALLTGIVYLYYWRFNRALAVHGFINTVTHGGDCSDPRGHGALSQNEKRRETGRDHAERRQQGGRRASSLITM